MPAIPPRVNILGVEVCAITLQEAVEIIDFWIASHELHYVCVTGVHGIMESRRDPELRRIHNAAGLVTPDGMPLVWLCRWQGYKNISRVYGPDLMLALCKFSQKAGYRHFFYGGKPGVAQELTQTLTQRFPGMQIAGNYCPPFRPLTAEEDAAIISQINASGADIVWIGLSTPKQERWMAEHLGKIEAPVMIGVGAAFDFHTGRVPQAPRWMQKIALEWLFRLIVEPKRLGKRYLKNNPEFLVLIILQLLGIRQK